MSQQELQKAMSNQLLLWREEGACATYVEEVGQFCISTEFQSFVNILILWLRLFYHFI
jgi:hypothetical protein